MPIRVPDHLAAIATPLNLQINDRINRLRRECERRGCDAIYHHFAFGQSPFPPPPTVVEALRENADKHSYLPTGGLPELREAVAGYYRSHFGLETSAAQVVVSPAGPVIVPTPSWVSYLPQARLLGKEVISIRTRTDDGYRLTPELLEHSLRDVSGQKLLVLNHPNNPTGATYDAQQLHELAAACRAHDVIVLADEIYALTSFDPAAFTSMAKVFPEGTIVTGGLSKDRSCGGYRLGVGLFPERAEELIDSALKVGGSTYSCVAAPIQYAALEAYSNRAAVEDHVNDCRQINALAGRAVQSRLAAIPGVTASKPGGAFYTYVDFNGLRDRLQAVGLKTCRDLCDDLMAVEHTALLPGIALLLPDDDFSVRCSYVDYDGAQALRAWRHAPPTTDSEERAFVEAHFANMLRGGDNIARHLGELAAGRRPVHS